MSGSTSGDWKRSYGRVSGAPPTERGGQQRYPTYGHRASRRLYTTLGVAEGLTPIQQHVWIADTCIECDHQRFGGFLKIPVEELIIALRR